MNTTYCWPLHIIPQAERDNLRKLAHYLISEQIKDSFIEVVNLKQLNQTDIFTKLIKWYFPQYDIAGYARNAGIPKLPNETYEKYAGRVSYTRHLYDDCFEWCFGIRWFKLDNTPKNTGIRILYMLENDIEQHKGKNYSKCKQIYTKWFYKEYLPKHKQIMNRRTNLITHLINWSINESKRSN